MVIAVQTYLTAVVEQQRAEVRKALGILLLRE